MVDGVFEGVPRIADRRGSLLGLEQVVQKLGSSSLSTRDTAAGQALPQRRMKYKLQLFTADQARLTHAPCVVLTRQPNQARMLVGLPPCG